MNKEFGQILEELIKGRNLSVRQFAKEVNLPGNTVSEWVGKNARFPSSPEVLKRIANYFSISVHELLYGEPEPNSILGDILERTEIHSGLYEITIKKVQTKK